MKFIVPAFQNKRVKIAYFLTLASLFGLIIGFSFLLWKSYDGNIFKTIFSAAIILFPLLFFLPDAIFRNLKSYQYLSLLAAWYFFISGLIYLLSDSKLVANFLIFCSLSLQIGTILHNFKKRVKNKKSVS